MDGKNESRISVLSAWFDDDDNDDIRRKLHIEPQVS